MAQVKSDMYYYDIVRKNIRKYRKEKGFTQQRLADEADMSIDYLAEIESVKRRKTFSLATLGRIADVLEVDIRDFFNNN
ncbi:MAG: helix-turn-helix transcriptional regulator [Tenericutes bacterium]|nr:helix-turn-helix transcriptional regulator [Mycoplasmatota bacterium]